MKNIAIIPARSGSKGLPDKNIRELCGKPMLAYSIEAAKKSGKIDVVHVSTDSEHYAEIAREYGADVPFLRREELSSDTATTWDAVRFVLEEYKKLGKQFDVVTLLQPTSPLRIAEDITNASKLYFLKSATAVVGVCEMEHSPLWSNTLSKNLSMDGFLSKATNVQRQKLDTYYRINGAIYMMDSQIIINRQEIYGEKSYAYIMPKERSIDVDDLMDFKIAEMYMKEREKICGI
ncbi:MAG: acylneuraminate cytidylyltransferase family protein [Lachnospiraceae bacterium]|nr:acylneuraminate cytidylyltransferase family protein [Lachnospiraceae bacterium]